MGGSATNNKRGDNTSLGWGDYVKTTDFVAAEPTITIIHALVVQFWDIELLVANNDELILLVPWSEEFLQKPQAREEAHANIWNCKQGKQLGRTGTRRQGQVWRNSWRATP